MSLRQHHVPSERLAALALIATRDTVDEEDHDALAHAASCSECGWRLARLTAELDDLRTHARHEADQLFDEDALAAQRQQIQAQVAALAHSPRVVRFPATLPRMAMPMRGANRRWIGIAAAAAFVIGLVTGQLVNVLPETGEPAGASAVLERIGPVRAASPDAARIVNARATLTDEELMSEIDAAIQMRRASELQALDALTPALAEIR